jgi:phosphate transport system permease protein
MSITESGTLTKARPPAVRRTLTDRPTAQDQSFVAAARSAAVSTLIIMGLIGIFLLIGAWPALHSQGFAFLTRTEWLPETGTFGIASLLWGTILVGLIALAVAVPVGFGAALFISEYAPRSLKRSLVSLVDLMAAVPSIVYAMWALFFLQAHLLTIAQWLSVHFGSVLPFLRVNTPDSPSSYTSSAFIAGIAVGVVVLPTITSIMREVFAQAPIGEREGAIALGATRWGMIRAVVIPFGRAGIVGAVMLGLGRALGETIAVTIILSQPSSLDKFDLSVFFGGETFASKIANNASEFSTPQKTGAYIAAGLVLFVITFAVNAVARWVISRSARED